MAKTKQEKVARNNKIGQYIAIATGLYYLGKMILDRRQKIIDKRTTCFTERKYLA